MKDQTKRIRRIWFAWKDAEEERWLAEQSLQGWHLTGITWNSYTLRKGEPQPYVYRYDFRPGLKDKEEYFGLFRDAGWEPVGETASWYCFRGLPGCTLSSDIFTDQESRVAKYGRLAGLLAIFLVIQFPSLNSTFSRVGSRTAWTPFLVAILCLQVAIVLLLGYALVRVAMRMSRIRRGGDRTGAASGT